MKREDILQKITNIVNDNIFIKVSEIKEEHRFREDIGADSLDKVSLFMDFEKEFDINIPDEDVEKILTIKETIDYLVNRI